MPCGGGLPALTVLAAAFFTLFTAVPARAEPPYTKELEKRKTEVSAVFKAARKKRSPPKTAAELKGALATAQKMYGKWLPGDCKIMVELQPLITWTLMAQWHTLATQQLSMLSSEAERLNKGCRAMGSEAAAAGEDAARTAAAAKKLLKFTEGAAWGEDLKKHMLGEVRDIQVKAVKDWDKLAACVSGK